MMLPDQTPPVSETADETAPARPYFSCAGLRDGALAMSAVILSQSAFGFVFGTLAAQKALSLTEAVIMSGVVYAGLSQVVGLQNWPHDFTAATLVPLALATATVNLRFFLMSLTFRPWFGALPAWQAYPTLFFTTDAGWLRAMRYREAGGNDVGFFLGSGLLLYASWLLSTALGHAFSTWLADPKAFGLDLLIPAFFAALLIPAWRGARRAVPWLVAGLVALAVQFLVQGYWYIIAGAISGALVAGLDRDA